MMYIARLGILAASLVLSPVYSAENFPAQDFTLPTNQGTVQLAALRGQVVYLDFWASWCGPCRKSFPWMNSMQSRYGKDGLTIIAVNLDKEKELATSFLGEVPTEFTVAYDPEGKVAAQYQLMGMPTSFLIDRQGMVHRTHIGFRDVDKQALESDIQQLIRQ